MHPWIERRSRALWRGALWAVLLFGCGGSGSGAPPDGAAEGGRQDGGAGRDGAASDGGDARDGGRTGGCATDPPDAESIEAAEAALRSGAASVALSPGGCVRLERSEEGPGVTTARLLLDGRIQQRWRQEGTSGSWELDADGDGLPEARRSVERNASGQVVRAVLESGIDSSGVPALRRTLVRGSGRVQVTEERRDASGSLSESERYEVPEEAYDLVVEAGSGPGQCTDAQVSQLRNAMRQAILEGIRCTIDRSFPALALWVSTTVLLHTITVRCDELPGTIAAQIDILDALFPALQGPGSVQITVDPSAFFGLSQSNRHSVLWHELLHSYFGPHSFSTPDGPSARFVDKVYACADMCFNDSTTACQCAVCLDTGKCDPRCAGLDTCTDTMFQCNCPSRPDLYETDAQCRAECPSGLSCAFAGCSRLDYGC